MRRLAILGILAGMVLMGSSCEKDSPRIHVKPSGNVTSEEISISDFSGIEVSTAFTVQVEFAESVGPLEIRADDNLHEYIVADVYSGTLRIGIMDNVDIEGEAVLKAYVTASQINNIWTSGAVYMDIIDTLMGDNVSIELSGASWLGAHLNVNNLLLICSGASEVSLGGEVGMFDVRASGASFIYDYTLAANKLIANLSGASILLLTVNEEIDITAEGASILYYKGNPVFSSASLSGASMIIDSN